MDMTAQRSIVLFLQGMQLSICKWFRLLWGFTLLPSLPSLFLHLPFQQLREPYGRINPP